MDAPQGTRGYVITEVRVEQWVLAALRLQRGLSLKPRQRARRRSGPVAKAPASRRSLWLMLGVSCLGLALL